MRRGSQILFAVLILVQAAHSIEEYRFRLWEVLAPARVFSSMASRNPAVGFAIVNVALVSFGAWCYIARVRRSHTSARVWAWFWTVLEAANGTAHLVLSGISGGYFPGAVTAPFLVGVSAALGTTLLRVSEPKRG